VDLFPSVRSRFDKLSTSSKWLPPPPFDLRRDKDGDEGYRSPRMRLAKQGQGCLGLVLNMSIAEVTGALKRWRKRLQDALVSWERQECPLLIARGLPRQRAWINRSGLRL
jgi:hypothetical protein